MKRISYFFTQRGRDVVSNDTEWGGGTFIYRCSPTINTINSKRNEQCRTRIHVYVGPLIELTKPLHPVYEELPTVGRALHDSSCLVFFQLVFSLKSRFYGTVRGVTKAQEIIEMLIRLFLVLKREK